MKPKPNSPAGGTTADAVKIADNRDFTFAPVQRLDLAGNTVAFCAEIAGFKAKLQGDTGRVLVADVDFALEVEERSTAVEMDRVLPGVLDAYSRAEIGRSCLEAAKEEEDAAKIPAPPPGAIFGSIAFKVGRADGWKITVVNSDNHPLFGSLEAEILGLKLKADKKRTLVVYRIRVAGITPSGVANLCENLVSRVGLTLQHVSPTLPFGTPTHARPDVGNIVVGNLAGNTFHGLVTGVSADPDGGADAVEIDDFGRKSIVGADTLTSVFRVLPPPGVATLQDAATVYVRTLAKRGGTPSWRDIVGVLFERAAKTAHEGGAPEWILSADVCKAATREKSDGRVVPEG